MKTIRRAPIDCTRCGYLDTDQKHHYDCRWSEFKFQAGGVWEVVRDFVEWHPELVLLLSILFIVVIVGVVISAN